MSFFLILRESGLDWNRARDTFYNLTDIQIAWLNAASLKEAKRIKEESNNTSSSMGSIEKKSFNLRN